MTVYSRAPSAGTRAGSVARSIVRKRDKAAYKTEKVLITAKKKRLNLHTTYRDTAPQGYQFLPVGTPDLANRCKELSRLGAHPVYVVNAEPVSRHAHDPAKVSHHVHRIGYHFLSAVVEQACEELGYVPYGNKFVKPEELQAQLERSRMAQVLAKHGMKLDQTSRRESDDQVRAAIKELFPKIPEEDLKEILRRAWEEGSGRVGSSSSLELPRRVQLATIARIRHKYTDYDYLLRAFGDWTKARASVEPDCLAKLIEWRGENDPLDETEFEEIVRETIVIDDDDDDDPRNGHHTIDEGAETPGSDSDRVEISYRPAEDSEDENKAHTENWRRFLDNHQPRRNQERRYQDFSEKFGQVREQMRKGTYVAQPPRQANSNVIQIQMPENGDTVQIAGRTYRVAATPTTPVQVLQTPPGGAYGIQPAQALQARVSQSFPRVAHSVDNLALHDRPVASIEPNDDLRRIAIASQHNVRPRPATPEGGRSRKRFRTDITNDSSFQLRSSPIKISSDSSGPTPRHANYVDLTADSPPREYYRAILQPMMSGVHGDVGGAQVRGVNVNYQSQPTSPQLAQRTEYYSNWMSGREQERRPGLVDSQVAPVQYMPLPRTSTETIHSRGAIYGVPPATPALGKPLEASVGAVQHGNSYYVPQPPRQRTGPSCSPYLVHGAPAAVQPHAVPGQSYAAPQPMSQPPPNVTFAHPPQPQYQYPR